MKNGTVQKKKYPIQITTALKFKVSFFYCLYCPFLGYLEENLQWNICKP